MAGGALFFVKFEYGLSQYIACLNESESIALWDVLI